jgi:spermidine synthase
MNDRFSNEPAPHALRSLLPFLLLLFFGSGCAALIYEIVWFQMLQLVIGSSAVSLGVLVGTYMGGMCLGSVVLPRIISAARHPLRVYALLETGIGLLGILILFGMPETARIYSAHVGSGLTGILLRGLFASACLLPPTILMGATLPAMARRLESTPHGVSWLGFFYGGNIAGAVFGCLFAGFYLLRIHDSAFATYVAAAINGTVALAAVALSVSTRFEQQVGAQVSGAARTER